MADFDDQELQRLNDEISRLQQSMLQLANSQQVGSSQWNKINSQLSNVQNKYKAIISSQESFANSVGKGTAAVGKMAVGAVKAGSSFAEAASAVRQSREDFTSLNPSINLAGSALKTTGKLAGVAGEALGGLAGGIPVVGGVIGGAINAVGKFAAAITEAAAEILTTVGEKVTAEVQRASEAFRTVGQVGGLTAGGLTELMNQSIDAGLSFTQFSAVASKGAEGLAFAFGDASEGIERFSRVSADMEPFRQGLIALGVGAEKQNELTTKYLLLQARTGRVETMSARALAQGSEEYIRKLSTLSRITGRSIDDQQAIMDAQTRNIRLMGAAADIQERLGGEEGRRAALAMQTTSAAIETVASKEIADGLRDAMAGNYGTEAAIGFVLAAGQEGKAAVDALRAGTISDLDATALIMQGINNKLESLGGSGGIAALVGLGTPLDAVFEGMFNVSQRANLTAEDLKKLKESQDSARTATDTTTADLIAAQVALRQAAIEADKMAKELMGPAASAVKEFAEIVQKSNTEMLKMLKIFSEGGIEGLKSAITPQIMPDSTGLVDFTKMNPEEKKIAQQQIQERLEKSRKQNAETWENIKKMFFGRFVGSDSGTMPAGGNSTSPTSATPDYGNNSDLLRLLEESRKKFAPPGTSDAVPSTAGPAGTLQTSSNLSDVLNENLKVATNQLASQHAESLARKEVSDLTIEKLTELVTAMQRANSTSQEILNATRRG